MTSPLPDDIAAARAGGDGENSLEGLTITADALHVHRDNLQQVTDRGGEYILAVKGNMPSLERDIAALFPASPADGAFPLTTSPLTAATAAMRSAPSGAHPTSPTSASPAPARPSASTARSMT